MQEGGNVLATIGGIPGLILVALTLLIEGAVLAFVILWMVDEKKYMKILSPMDK